MKRNNEGINEMKKHMINEKNQATPSRIVPVTQEAFAKRNNTAITWLGNAGVLLNIRGTTILVDPLLLGFDMPLLFKSPLSLDDVTHLDAYLVSHIDNDHFSRETCSALLPVCKTYHSTQYVSEEMNRSGIRGIGHQIGEGFFVNDVEVTLTPAKHDWQNGVEKFSYRVWNEEDSCGFWFHTPDGTIWLPGDSRLLDCHLHMQNPDVILFDFSDNEWHITLDGAIRLANAYPHAKLICIHWGTVDAPDMTPFNGNPDDLFGKIQNPERICVLWPGEPIII